MPDEVVDFLADNINANVREIRGSSRRRRWCANASFLGKKITVTLAREILKRCNPHARFVTAEGHRRSIPHS
ncbi:MAG: hypothetical protein ACLR8Y_18880 [Alistipes indistinctus]